MEAKIQQKIWSCFTQNAIDKRIAKSWKLGNRAAQAAFEWLERNKAKVLRYVLREVESSNALRLPDNGIRDSIRNPRIKREPHSSPAFFRSRNQLEARQGLIEGISKSMPN